MDFFTNLKLNNYHHFLSFQKTYIQFKNSFIKTISPTEGVIVIFRISPPKWEISFNVNISKRDFFHKSQAQQLPPLPQLPETLHKIQRQLHEGKSLLQKGSTSLFRISSPKWEISPNENFIFWRNYLKNTFFKIYYKFHYF